MHILVISLPTEETRRREISSRLTELGLEFEFVDAIDGRAKDPAIKYSDQIDHEAVKDFWRPLTKTELACSLTHAFACQYIVDKIKEPTIILEDDAILTQDFGKLVNSEVLENSGYELVLLYHNNTRVVKWPKKQLFDRYTLRVPLKAPWGAVAYYVTPGCARKIVENSLPVTGVADWGFDILDLAVGCIVPRIVEHPPVDPNQTTMVERDSTVKMPDRVRRTVFQKAMDRKYRRYFFRKIRAEWIYRP